MIANYCATNGIPLRDLYKVTNGSGAAYYWSSAELMSKGGIHFSASGYQLQGQLLFNALAKAYNEFTTTH